MKHRHSMKVIGWTGLKSITRRCVCGHEVSRPMTKREIWARKKADLSDEVESQRQNRVCHEFDRTFRVLENRPVTIGGKKVKSLVDTGWKYEGYEFMSRVRKWAKKYPNDVYICGIDDAHFASSDIVFILHRPSPKRIWGTTVIVITQCDGKPPKEFFMYPGHASGILETLQEIGKLKSRFP